MRKMVIIWNIATPQSIVLLKQMIIPLLLIMLIVSVLTLIALLLSTVPSARNAEQGMAARRSAMAATAPPTEHSNGDFNERNE